jgi:hypothetical protein
LRTLSLEWLASLSVFQQVALDEDGVLSDHVEVVEVMGITRGFEGRKIREEEFEVALFNFIKKNLKDPFDRKVSALVKRAQEDGVPLPFDPATIPLGAICLGADSMGIVRYQECINKIIDEVNLHAVISFLGYRMAC